MFTFLTQLIYMKVAHSQWHSQGSLRMCFDCNTAVKCILTSAVKELFEGFNNWWCCWTKITQNTCYVAQPAFENYVVSHKKLLNECKPIFYCYCSYLSSPKHSVVVCSSTSVHFPCITLISFSLHCRGKYCMFLLQYIHLEAIYYTFQVYILHTKYVSKVIKCNQL